MSELKKAKWGKKFSKYRTASLNRLVSWTWDLKDVERIAGINLRARRLRERHAHRAAGCQDMDTPCIGIVQVQNERRKETAPATDSLAAAPDEP